VHEGQRVGEPLFNAVSIAEGYEPRMTTMAETCAHVACLCTRPYPRQAQAASTERIDPNGTYCSKRCAERARGELGDGGCLCGHAQCQRDASVGIPPM
jgi:hypothetical protein